MLNTEPETEDEVEQTGHTAHPPGHCHTLNDITTFLIRDQNTSPYSPLRIAFIPRQLIKRKPSRHIAHVFNTVCPASTSVSAPFDSTLNIGSLRIELIKKLFCFFSVSLRPINRFYTIIDASSHHSISASRVQFSSRLIDA